MKEENTSVMCWQRIADPHLLDFNPTSMNRPSVEGGGRPLGAGAAARSVSMALAVFPPVLEWSESEAVVALAEALEAGQPKVR
eukprot:scaffold75470_cov20-Prasinocladus_malaysianus.AAC.1